jgi:tRNA nucleotidyltransferase/poly(A) polymerase
VTERRAGTLALLRHHPVAQALRAAASGLEPHFVGGILRDRLLGLPAADFDAVVSAQGAGVAERLAGSLRATLVPLGGGRFAAFRLVGKDFTLDLWDRESGSIEADLGRRDLTVNAIALDLSTGRLRDPHDGLGDLRRRVLRAVGPAAFRADPLRTLRLARLLVQLPGFAADPLTVELARTEAPRLPEIAAERVREELRRLLAGADAHRGILLLDALQVYPGLWLGRPGESATHGGAIEEMEQLATAALELRRMTLGWADALDLPVARWASTFAALESNADAAIVLRRFSAAGLIARRDADRVAAILLVRELPRDELAMRHFLHDSGELWPTAAVWLGCRALRAGTGEDWRRWLASLVGLLEAAGAEILDPPTLLRGDEVQKIIGAAPGPEVGRALARVRSAQVEGRVRSREQAIALLRSLV